MTSKMAITNAEQRYEQGDVFLPLKTTIISHKWKKATLAACAFQIIFNTLLSV